MDTKYNPSNYEKRLLEDWLKNKISHSEPDNKKSPFTIVIPPPNVTGVLHMGHALNNTYQDILIRYNRMSGENSCWIPGTDHAGIATQNVVERKIGKDGKTRHDIGREKFIEHVWDWKHHHGNYIIDQLKKLGCSCDWDRERFTMDDGLSKAVFTAFENYYKKGLLYKGDFIINWCPRCETALSDIETEYEELPGKLYHVKYYIKDSDEYIVVATTRPETMLGDVAVAFHPEDERYLHLKGKKLILPILNKEIDIIFDDYVDKDFGTGGVKITPAHDPNDFEMGKRHNLKPVLVLTEDGKMNENTPDNLRGLDRFEARKKVVEILKEQGFLIKIEDHDHNVGHCYRCHTVVEPYLSKQWFVNMKPLAKKAIEAVESGEITFTPERWKKVFLEWMYNIRDWCISRQIWWGHRIPVYYCDECSEMIVSSGKPEKCSCGSASFTQDEDVLDTWFSSALWPFSTLGWPENTEELEYYYPTSTLITAPEILFFWVARMIMSGYEFMGKKPFSNVFLTGTVRDETGRKMSKSYGNVIDPLKIIEKYGADALRFTLMVITAQGQDVFLSDDKFQIGRNFANKLWNASRFVITNMNGFNPDFEEDKLDLQDKYILTRMNNTITEVRKAVKDFRFDVMSKSIYEFMWDDFCDWYIEGMKPFIYSGDKNNNKLKVAAHILDNALRLLHPVMPFITEEIYNHLTGNKEYLINSNYPEYSENNVFENEEKQFVLVQEIARELRNLKANSNIKRAVKIDVYVDFSKVSDDVKQSIEYFGGCNIISFEGNTQEKKYSKIVVGDIEFYVDLSDHIDLDEERKRLEGELKKLTGEIKRSENMLNNKKFVEKAPEKLVEKEKEKYKQYMEQKEKLEQTFNNLFK